MACPNCGHCPHCGRSDAQPLRPHPFVPPFAGIPRPWYGPTVSPNIGIRPPTTSC